MRICEYVEPDSEHAGFHSSLCTYRTYVAGPGGHAGRGRDAKPGTSHQGEVTAIYPSRCYQLVFFDFTAILIGLAAFIRVW